MAMSGIFGSLNSVTGTSAVAQGPTSEFLGIRAALDQQRALEARSLMMASTPKWVVPTGSVEVGDINEPGCITYTDTSALRIKMISDAHCPPGRAYMLDENLFNQTGKLEPRSGYQGFRDDWMEAQRGAVDRMQAEMTRSIFSDGRLSGPGPGMLFSMRMKSEWGTWSNYKEFEEYLTYMKKGA